MILADERLESLAQAMVWEDPIMIWLDRGFRLAGVDIVSDVVFDTWEELDEVMGRVEELFASK